MWEQCPLSAVAKTANFHYNEQQYYKKITQLTILRLSVSVFLTLIPVTGSSPV